MINEHRNKHIHQHSLPSLQSFTMRCHTNSLWHFRLSSVLFVTFFISISFHLFFFFLCFWRTLKVWVSGFIALHDTDNNRTEKGVNEIIQGEHSQFTATNKMKEYNNLPWNYIQMKVSNSLFQLSFGDCDCWCSFSYRYCIHCYEHVLLSFATCPIIKSKDYCWNTQYV